MREREKERKPQPFRYTVQALCTNILTSVKAVERYIDDLMLKNLQRKTRFQCVYIYIKMCVIYVVPFTTWTVAFITATINHSGKPKFSRRTSGQEREREREIDRLKEKDGKSKLSNRLICGDKNTWLFIMYLFVNSILFPPRAQCAHFYQPFKKLAIFNRFVRFKWIFIFMYLILSFDLAPRLTNELWGNQRMEYVAITLLTI